VHGAVHFGPRTSYSAAMLIQFILVGAFAVALALTWRRASQNTLARRTAILWSALWIGAAVIVMRPEVASFFASVVGVGRGVDAVVYVAIIVLYALLFRIFLRLERIDRDITALTRIVSLAARDGRGESEE
jgi:hypothetical protein